MIQTDPVFCQQDSQGTIWSMNEANNTGKMAVPVSNTVITKKKPVI